MESLLQGIYYLSKKCGADAMRQEYDGVVTHSYPDTLDVFLSLHDVDNIQFPKEGSVSAQGLPSLCSWNIADWLSRNSSSRALPSTATGIAYSSFQLC